MIEKVIPFFLFLILSFQFKVGQIDIKSRDIGIIFGRNKKSLFNF